MTEGGQKHRRNRRDFQLICKQEQKTVLAADTAKSEEFGGDQRHQAEVVTNCKQEAEILTIPHRSTRLRKPT